MRKTKILIIAVTLILLGLTILINWQYNNFKAVYYSYKYSNEDIDKLIQTHYDEIDKYLKENGRYNVRQSTELEEKLHGSNIITDEELIDLLTGKKSLSDIFGMEVELDKSQKVVSSDGTVISDEELKSAKDKALSNQNSSVSKPKPDNHKLPSQNETNNPGEQTSTNNTTNQSVDDKVSEYIAKMYVLKSSFESQLDGIYNSSKAYYVSLTPEQRKSSKSELAKSIYSQASALEASCDAQVSVVLSELEAVLTASGQSTELVSRIQTAYTEEKSLKKAYYINLYNS